MSRVCVYGAGAIGGLIALHLVKGGADVSVVARGAHLEAIRDWGITVKRQNGSTDHVRVAMATADPRDIGPQDVVIVSVKHHALPDVAAKIAPLLNKNTAVIFIGNGIPWWFEKDDTSPYPIDDVGLLESEVGHARTIGGLAYCACDVVSPGIVFAADYPSSVVIGEPDGEISTRAQAVARMLIAGGLACTVTNDVRGEVWRKLPANLASGPICLLTGSSMRDSFGDPAIRAAAIRLVEEGMQIATKASSQSLRVEAADVVDRLAGADHKPSILKDLELGRPMEVEPLLLRPQQIARRLRIPTPTHDLLLALSQQAQRFCHA
jgi:2-dehydropantoate 2-reductase